MDYGGLKIEHSTQQPSVKKVEHERILLGMGGEGQFDCATDGDSMDKPRPNQPLDGAFQFIIG